MSYSNDDRKPSKLIWIIVAGGALVAGWLLGHAVPISKTTTTADTNRRETQDVSPPDEIILEIASPDMTPRQVVERQMESVRASSFDIQALRVCYSLAAPSNRAVTGPFERFAQMIQSPSFYPMRTSDQWLVGDGVIEGELATVFVTVIDAAGLPHAFRFYLERQRIEPHEGCWMTVSVNAMEGMPGRE